MKKQKSKFTGVVLLGISALVLAHAPAAQADVISVNLNGSAFTDPGIALGTTAGVVPEINWNNVTDVVTAITYHDDSGPGLGDTTLGVVVVGGGIDSWNTTGTADQRLGSDWVNGYTGLTLTDVPYAEYDLYIYNSTFAASGAITFSISGEMDQVMNYTIGSPTSFSPTFQQDVNYVVFSGLTADATVTLSGVSAGLSAFQIVGAAIPVPEPGTMSLLAIGGLGVLLMRRRRRRS